MNIGDQYFPLSDEPLWATLYCRKGTGRWEPVRHSRRHRLRHWLIDRLGGTDDEWQDREFHCETIGMNQYVPTITFGDYSRSEE